MNADTASGVNGSEEATDTETARYEKAYRETRRVLDESIETLAILEELETSTDMKDQIALKRMQLESSRADLARANIAYHAGRATMSPPSAELVAEIAGLSRQAVELTVERATAAAVLRLATKALGKFAQIQNIAPTP